MEPIKTDSPLSMFFKERVIRGALLWCVPLLLVLTVFAVHGQQVTETYRLGNNIEDITFISSGPLAGKVAIADGWGVYILDPATGTYEKHFEYDAPIQVSTRGLAYISEGDFTGNLLMDDPGVNNKLFMFSFSGDLTYEVTLEDFTWQNHCEALTQITSGPYDGCFAMVGWTDEDSELYIFRIENDMGTARAYIEKTLVLPWDDLDGAGLGVTFLDDNYPDPALRNHFILTSVNASWIAVFDDNGVLKERHSWDDYLMEGVAYMSSGPFQGKIIVADHISRGTALCYIDGSDRTVYNDLLGIGFARPAAATWLPSTGQFVMAMSPFYSHPGRAGLITRHGTDTWTLDLEVEDSSLFTNYMDIVTVERENCFYVLRALREFVPGIGNAWVSSILRLDYGFNLLETIPLPDSCLGKYFRCLLYLPGETAAEDKFALGHWYDRWTGTYMNQLYVFGPGFIDEPVITGLDGKVERLRQGYYDPERDRYLFVDGYVSLNILDGAFNPVANFDVSVFGLRNIYEVTKIASGPLAGQYAVFDTAESKIVLVDVEQRMAVDSLEGLIETVLGSGIHGGTMNSLEQKLQNALKSIEKGQTQAAINQLEAFRNQVLAQRGKKIPTALADQWLEIIGQIILDLS